MATLIDCEKITRAVFADEEKHDDVWEAKLDSCSSCFGNSELCLYVKGCGRLTLPITKEAIQHLLSSDAEDLLLMKMADKPIEHSMENNTVFICGERVKLISDDPMQEPLPSIISYVSKSMFGTEDPKVVNDFLKLHMDKVILFHGKFECKSSLMFNEAEAYPGICYTVLLFIPTEDGFAGGRVSVATKLQEIRKFEFEKDSNKVFGILLFPANSRYEIEPIVKGSAVIAVLHMIWTDSFVANYSNPSLSKTIKLYQNIKSLLLPWESLNGLVTYQEGSASVNMSKVPVSIESSLVTETETSEDIKMEVDDDTQLTDPTSEEKTDVEGKFLIFPLNERYSLSNIISSSQLIGHDQLLAHVLQSLDFIDVHLAVVSLCTSTNDECQLTNSSDSSAARCVGVYQWIGLEDSLPQGTAFDLFHSSKLIGKPCHYLFDSLGVDGQVLHNHYALVAQPRNQSIVLSCMHNFDRALDCLESRLWPLLRLARSRRATKREKLASDLMKVINLCSKEPAHVFNSKAPKADQRAVRMLNLCLHLRAEEETLALLSLLGEFSIESEAINSKSLTVFYGGLPSEETSRIVADLELRVVDWKVSADVILRLISPLRIFRQLNCFVRLAHHFLVRNRFEAARQIANRISDILSKLTSDQTNALQSDHLKLYAPLVFSLELNKLTADEERLENYFALYRKLKYVVKNAILTDLKDFQKTPATLKVYEEMVEAALVDSFTIEPFESRLPVFRIVLSLTNENLQLRLISRISSERDATRRCAIVNCILSSLNPADIAHYSDAGLVAISNFLDTATENIKSQAVTLYGNGTTQPPSQDPNFRNNLHLLVRYIIFMENDERSASASRVAGLGHVLYSLPLTCLCHLIQDLRTSGGDALRKLPRSYNLFFEICQMIGLRRREFIAKLPAPTIVELMGSFIWLGDIHLASDLVRQLNFEEPDNVWNQHEVCSLLSTMVSNADLWQLLVPGSSRYACQTINTLLRTWMMSIIGRLNETPTSREELAQLRNLIVQEAISCLTLYVRNSLRFPEEANSKIDEVSTLMKLLSPVEVSQTIVRIRETNKVYWKIYEETGRAAKVYPNICAQLTRIDLNDLALSQSDLLLSALMCAFLVQDEKLPVTLVQKITSIPPANQENLLVASIVASASIRELARTSVGNREALFQLIEHRINWLRVSIDKWGSQKAIQDQSAESDELSHYQEAALMECEELRVFLANLQDLKDVSSSEIGGDSIKIETVKLETNLYEPNIADQATE